MRGGEENDEIACHSAASVMFLRADFFRPNDQSEMSAVRPREISDCWIVWKVCAGSRFAARQFQTAFSEISKSDAMA